MNIHTSIESNKQSEPPSIVSEDFKKRTCNIKLLAIDIDGVMTDGGLYYDHNGLCMKRFNVLDGLAIRIAQDAQLMCIVISGSNISTVIARLEYIGIYEYYGDVANKYQKLKTILQQKNLQWDEVAYVGDDWVDLAVMSSVGLPIAVANAVPEVKDVACYTTQKYGGHGAIREVVDLIILFQKKKNNLLHKWMNLK